METRRPNTATDETDPAEARAKRHLRMLQELAEIATKLAQAAGKKVLARIAAEVEAAGEAPEEKPGAVGGPQEAEPSGEDLMLAFARMAWQVQQNLALQTGIEEGPRKRVADRARGDAATRPLRTVRLTQGYRGADEPVGRIADNGTISVATRIARIRPARLGWTKR